ncbi:hypothetical protein GCM10009760_26150 [Kitasatospora kazusensis]|uniref:Uncharacterized protein n=2 Tax=Kitasatospora kazusensis TaxID=407974 RepID=A0ABN2ZG65_9ACTN
MWAQSIGRAVPAEILQELSALTDALVELGKEQNFSTPTLAQAKTLADHWSRATKAEEGRG